METLTKEFFVEQFDSFQTDVKKEFDSVRSEMATKKDLDLLRTEVATKKDLESLRAKMSTDIESLAEMTSNAFTGMTEQFVSLETKVNHIDSKVAQLETRVEHIDTNLNTLIGFDHQHQIDVLRDDMRVVKTKLGIA